MNKKSTISDNEKKMLIADMKQILQIESADIALEKLKDIETKAKKLNLLHEVFYQEAELYKIKNNLPQALYHYTLSEKKSPQDSQFLANLHHKIGIVQWHLGRYNDSLEHFQKNLLYWQELKNEQNVANALSNIGTIYNRSGRLDEALKYFQQAKNIREKINDEKGIAISLNNIGIVYENKHDFEKALAFHVQSLGIKEKLQDEQGSAITKFNIGEIYYEKGDYENALSYGEDALQVFLKSKDIWKIAYCQHLIGKIFSRTNQYKEAESVFLNALEQAKKLKADDVLKMIYESLSELYQNQKNYKKSLTYYKLFTESKDTIFNEANAKKMLQLEHKFEVEKAEKEAAIYRLKNVELAKANKLVTKANDKLKETNQLLVKEIEERKKAEAKIQSHQEHLQLINTILRHDLTNNLSVIKSAVKIFLDKNDIRLLHEINTYVYKSVSLIRKMREMEKLINDNQDLKSYQISKIVEQVCKNYQKVPISLEGDAYILTDDTIFSIFDNLLGNAIKHAQTEKIDIKVVLQKNYVEIRIIDYGLGIPDQYFEKIFDPNFTYGKNAGSGLGLHIVKKAMESISGGVFAEKNVPQGTIFVLLFRRLDM